MKISINRTMKIILVIACLMTAVIGFMVKLPSAFRPFDKELHTLFYFSAAAFLNLLFANRNIAIHLLFFGILYAFGISIEYAQAYSNKFFHTRIHGRYDPEDIRANLKGLLAFSAVWAVGVSLFFLYNKATVKEAVNES